MTKSYPSISIVIVTYFTGPSLWDCLRACLEQHVDQIIIVNNGNHQKTTNMLHEMQQQNAKITLIEGHGNIGFAKACNLGAKQASSDYLMFLNPDAIVQSLAITHLVQVLEKEPGLCLVGARLLNQNGTEQRGARRGRLTPWSALVSMTGLARFERYSPWFADMHWERRPLPSSPVPVPAVSGACMMFRTTDFQRVDRFDERYFLHVEDLDICRRMWDAGGKVIFVPSAEVLHIGSTSRVSVFQVNWSKAIGLVRYFYRFANSPLQKIAAISLSLLIVPAVMVRALWIALKR